MSTFINFIQLLCDVFTMLIVVRTILSWFLTNPTNRLMIILHNLTEPLLSPLRRIIPNVGMLDLTPLVAILLLQLISILLSFLY